MMKTINSIKVLVYSTFLFTGIIMASCSNNTSTNESQIDLSKNEKIKQEVFNQILNDEELMNDFLNQMMQNTEPMHWMMQHQPFMRHLFNQENVDYIMEHHRAMNLELMQNMMEVIQRDTSLEREWEMMYGDEHMDQMDHMR